MNDWKGYGRISYKGDLKYTGNDNTAVVRFSMAVNRMKHTEFIDCEAWGKTAEIFDKYFQKGHRCLVNGYLHKNEYTDKNGNKINTVVVRVTEFPDFVETKAESGNDQTMGNVGGDNMPMPSGDGFMNIPDGAMDELPFS